MPTVPKYQGGVDQNSIPTNRVPMEAPLSAFGGGDAIAGAAKQAETFVTTIQDRLDKTALIEADNQLTLARNDIMAKVREQKRKNAAGAPEIAQKDYNTTVDKIREGLNGRQQQKFDMLAGAAWKNLYEDTSKHMYSEIQAYKKETNLAGIQINQNDAINNYLDDSGNVNYAKIDESLIKQATIRDVEQQDEGYDDSIKSLQNLKDSTETHSAVINNMLAKGMDIKAKEYYGKYQGQIDKEAAKTVINNLEAGSSRVLGVQLADQLFNTPGMSESRALKELEKESNVDARILAESRIRQKYNDVEQGREKSKVYRLTNISNTLDSNGFNLSDPRVASQMQYLDINGKEAVRRYAQQRGFKVDNIEAADAMEDRLLDPTETVQDSEILAGEYSTGTKQKYLDLNREKEGNTEAYQKKVGEYSSEKDLIGIKVKQMGLVNKKMIGNFQDRAKREFKNFKTLTGKSPSTEQKQSIINELAMKQSTGWIGSDYKFNIAPKGSAEIPQAARDQIKSALLSSGKAVTEENIIALYELGELESINEKSSLIDLLAISSD